MLGGMACEMLLTESIHAAHMYIHTILACMVRADMQDSASKCCSVYLKVMHTYILHTS